MSGTLPLSRLGPGAGPGYEQPFEMLEACHERVHRMLDLLARLRAHLASQGVDDAGRQAARDVMRYFDLAAPQHHLDEERHVFPALMAGSDEALHALVRRLQADHQAMEAGWARIRTALDALATDGRDLGSADLEAIDAFTALYAGHITAEEQAAYPAARPLLEQSGGLPGMALDMMRRRGVTPDDAGNA